MSSSTKSLQWFTDILHTDGSQQARKLRIAAGRLGFRFQQVPQPQQIRVWQPCRVRVSHQIGVWLSSQVWVRVPGPLRQIRIGVSSPVAIPQSLGFSQPLRSPA